MGERPGSAISIAIHIERGTGEDGPARPAATSTVTLAEAAIETEIAFGFDDVGDVQLARDATWPRLVAWCDAMREALRSSPDGGIASLAIDEGDGEQARATARVEAKLGDIWWRTEISWNSPRDVVSASEEARRMLETFLSRIEAESADQARKILPGLPARLRIDEPPFWLFEASRILNIPLHPA